MYFLCGVFDDGLIKVDLFVVCNYDFVVFFDVNDGCFMLIGEVVFCYSGFLYLVFIYGMFFKKI